MDLLIKVWTCSLRSWTRFTTRSVGLRSDRQRYIFYILASTSSLLLLLLVLVYYLVTTVNSYHSILTAKCELQIHGAIIIAATRNTLVLELLGNYYAAVCIQTRYRGYRERCLRIQPDGQRVDYSLFYRHVFVQIEESTHYAYQIHGRDC